MKTPKKPKPRIITIEFQTPPTNRSIEWVDDFYVDLCEWAENRAAEFPSPENLTININKPAQTI